MSERLSDSDLIRICLEGSTDDLTDSVISQIDQRLAESILLRAAIAESPISSAIEEQLSKAGSDHTKQSATPKHETRNHSSVVTVFIVAIVIGTGIFWWNNKPNESPESDVAITPSNKSQADENRIEVSSSEETVSDSPSEHTKTAVADNSAMPEEGDNSKTKSDEQPTVVASSDQPLDNEDTPQTDAVTNTSLVNETAPKSTSADISREPTVDTFSPWTDELSLENPPRRFEDVAWQVPGEDEPDQFPPREFQQWFSKIPGKPFQVGEEKSSNRIFARFNGISKLNTPWVDSAVLRLGQSRIGRRHHAFQQVTSRRKPN